MLLRLWARCEVVDCRCSRLPVNRLGSCLLCYCWETNLCHGELLISEHVWYFQSFSTHQQWLYNSNLFSSAVLESKKLKKKECFGLFEWMFSRVQCATFHSIIHYITLPWALECNRATGNVVGQVQQAWQWKFVFFCICVLLPSHHSVVCVSELFWRC